MKGVRTTTTFQLHPQEMFEKLIRKKGVKLVEIIDSERDNPYLPFVSIEFKGSMICQYCSVFGNIIRPEPWKYLPKIRAG